MHQPHHFRWPYKAVWANVLLDCLQHDGQSSSPIQHFPLIMYHYINCIHGDKATPTWASSLAQNSAICCCSSSVGGGPSSLWERSGKLSLRSMWSSGFGCVCVCVCARARVVGCVCALRVAPPIYLRTWSGSHTCGIASAPPFFPPLGDGPSFPRPFFGIATLFS